MAFSKFVSSRRYRKEALLKRTEPQEEKLNKSLLYGDGDVLECELRMLFYIARERYPQIMRCWRNKIGGVSAMYVARGDLRHVASLKGKETVECIALP